MTVNSISSEQALYPANASTDKKKQYNDFTSLAQALRSGDLSAAQSAFQMFRNDVQNTTSKQSPFATASLIHSSRCLKLVMCVTYENLRIVSNETRPHPNPADVLV
jgi:hypothetical protein